MKSEWNATSLISCKSGINRFALLSKLKENPDFRSLRKLSMNKPDKTQFFKWVTMKQQEAKSNAYLQRCPSQYLRSLTHEALGGVTALFCNLLAHLPCWNKPIYTHTRGTTFSFLLGYYLTRWIYNTLIQA